MNDGSNDATLRRYLDDLAKHPPLTREEEGAALERAEKGDRRAADLLITSNLRFVVRVAREFEGRGLPLCDLIAEGNVGLLKAAERFDRSKGTKFITYAIWWIRQRIRGALIERRTVRTPVNRVDDLGKVAERARQMAHGLGRFPGAREVAADLGLPDLRVERAVATSWRETSLDVPVSDEGRDTTRLDRLTGDGAAPSDEVERLERCRMTEAVLSGLTDRERRIVCDSYGITCESPKTLRQISEVLGISRERVRQLRARALRKMRSYLRSRMGEYAGVDAM